MQEEKNMDNYKCPNVGCRSSFKYRSQRSRHSKICDKEPPTVVEDNKLVPAQTPRKSNWHCITCSSKFKHKNNCYRNFKNCRSSKKKRKKNIPKFYLSYLSKIIFV